MSSWQWFNDFNQEAKKRGDDVPDRLMELHRQAFELRETDPDRTLAMFKEGQRVATAYGHPWWVMLFAQWEVHGAIYYKRDFRNILDSAVRNLLTVSKPTYTGYPQRLWVTCDLITIYQCVDPVGHEEAIQAAITFLETEGSAESYNARYSLQFNKINFALSRKDLDEAMDLTMAAQGWLEADPDRHTAGHYRVDFTSYPAVIALTKRNWTELATTAEIAEEAARQSNRQLSLASALMWQAVAARNLGDGKQSARLFRAAQAQRSKIGGSPTSWFYDAWASYQELAGSLPEVLQIRNQEYNDIRNRGMLSYECWILTELCRLKIALGTFQPEDRETAYQATLRLRKPQSYIAALESAVRGKSTTE